MISAAAMVERPLLDNWVHPDGRVLVIGDAAHIFYVGRPFLHPHCTLGLILSSA